MEFLGLVVEIGIALIIGCIIAIPIMILYQSIRSIRIKSRIPEKIKKEVLEQDARKKDENVRYYQQSTGEGEARSGSNGGTGTGYKRWPASPTFTPEPTSNSTAFTFPSNTKEDGQAFNKSAVFPAGNNTSNAGNGEVEQGTRSRIESEELQREIKGPSRIQPSDIDIVTKNRRKFKLH